MDIFSGYVWIFISQLVGTLFWLFTKIFVRCFSHEAINSACSSNLCLDNYHAEYNNSETKIEAEEDCFKYSKDAVLRSERFEEDTDAIPFQQECSHQNDANGSEPGTKSNENCFETVPSTDCAENLGLEKEERMRFVFKFQYQTWNCGETFDSVNTDIDKASGSTNKHEFILGKSFSSLLDEPCVHSKYSPFEKSSDRNFEPESCESSCVDEPVRLKTVPSIEQQLDEHQVENLKNNVLVEEISADENLLSKDDSICVSFELDSMMSSIGDGFLSDTNFGTIVKPETLGNHDEENAVLKEDLDFEGEERSEHFDVKDRDTMIGIRRLEEETRAQDSEIDKQKLKGHCFQDRHVKNLHSSADSDLEDSYRFDAQWEHQEFIEQLKIELNKVRATGMPTTFETERIMEDLRPWEINEKYKHGSAINDLTQFYKSYTERMRKFDILNYQKLFAIGALKSKDFVLSFPSRENSSPSIRSFLPHIFHYSLRKKSESDLLKKFMREFYSDLEMAYVGQLCLSWEFLQWQYEKALQLWESDQYRFQSYNEVAEEFQQFQVLLLRFIENERFQGPRVEYYARNRCAMQNLLQVPVIRKDNAKEEQKFKTTDVDKDEITIDMLVEILEESISMIWRFIKSDKDASSLAHRGPRENQVKLQDPADSEFLIELQAEVQKLVMQKEKRINEFLKSRSSILKNFQKRQKDGRDDFLYFFPQVDVKLVWRVLNMSRITRDQLAWCRNKLNNINFVNRRIHLEASFLLFPCQ